jgi:hypothetical protein
MKPLPVALLTPDDARIWLRVAASIDPEYETTPASSARKADRRDAELMFERMNHWEWGRTPPHKWWFEDWPGPEGRSRTAFDDACYYWT